MVPARAQIRVRAMTADPASRPEETEDTVPADFTPDPAHEPRATDDQAPGGHLDQAQPAPSITPSTATSPAGRVSAGQPQRTRSLDAFDNPSKSSSQTWKPTRTRRKEVLKALGIFQRATADQLWRMLRPGDSHDRITRDTLNALKEQGKVRVETRLESGHQLWVLTERGHKEAKQLLPKDVRISALRKLEYDADGEPVEVTATTNTPQPSPRPPPYSPGPGSAPRSPGRPRSATSSPTATPSTPT
ncbi:hypothetical protein [Streptomyces europaeiscabiei]|uniref:hypothetical protein n=1 Tax=Streptomyces europaeiscabiei TaxID=146819 RepID=UPI0029AFF44A|nr:hypothetical protein [Streptomyces europaeiscabiei]MDX2524785.1 hypothetical protein [Streptomyces europaeiscabiei]MDX3716281.1 hypothetical protein [Streptomyces europaeiscabiei]MDX3833458.1 hypothetical protein [Streptomyces europaeiscabiei]MDX3866263.1 hypothetical protein [Streptomyces europaeiscabiei]